MGAGRACHTRTLDALLGAQHRAHLPERIGQHVVTVVSQQIGGGEADLTERGQTADDKVAGASDRVEQEHGWELSFCTMQDHPLMDQKSFDLGLAVGFFEAEGCIYVHPTLSTVTITLSNTDYGRLRRFQRIVSVGKLYSSKRYGNRKP